MWGRVKSDFAGSNPATGTNKENEMKLTREQYSTLLDIALEMAHELERMVDEMHDWLEANVQPL
jgi:hypothetical protein